MNTSQQQVVGDQSAFQKIRVALNTANTVVTTSKLTEAEQEVVHQQLATVAGLAQSQQESDTTWLAANPAPAPTPIPPTGTVSFPADPSIVGAASAPWVGQDVQAASGFTQVMGAFSPGNWSTTAECDTKFGGVQAYPNTGFDMGGTVDSYESIIASWSVTLPTDNTKTAGWAAFDLWFNNWANEVMILVDLTANSDYNSPAIAEATFGGKPWHLVGPFGKEYVWKPGASDTAIVNQPSGTIDIKAILTWMEANGYLPKGSTWTAASFGFEICDTEGESQTFAVNDFTWNALAA